MKTLEIIIHADGAMILTRGAGEFVDSDDMALFSKKLAEFSDKAGGAFSVVNLFVSEDLVFFKSFELPLKTPNLKEAVKYQLGLMVPFFEDTYLHNFSTIREKGKHRVSLYAVQHQTIDKYLEEIAEAGYTITGLFPESQRYVNRGNAKDRWALLMPGRFTKVLLFSGTHLEDRNICNTEPEFSQLSEHCGCDIFYHQSPPVEGQYHDASELLEKNPLLKEFNMLPASYRRPDYYKWIITALVALNIIGLLSLTGVKIYRLGSIADRVDTELSKIMPKIKEMKSLQDQEKELTAAIERINSIGSNPDLIGLLEKLTKGMPKSSYLDQIRLDKKSKAIHLQGYTDDISKLTDGLKAVGDIKLKSTSRRKNQTYFQVEITQQ